MLSFDKIWIKNLVFDLSPGDIWTIFDSSTMKKEKFLFYKLHRVHDTQLIKAIREDNAFQAGEKTSNFFYICVWPDLSNPYQGGAILSTFNPH